MPRIIMNRAFIARWTRMPHSIGRLSISESSHNSLSSAAFTTNIAESDFRHVQDVAFGREIAFAPARVLVRPGVLEPPNDRGQVGSFQKNKSVRENALSRGSSCGQRTQ